MHTRLDTLKCLGSVSALRCLKVSTGPWAAKTYFIMEHVKRIHCFHHGHTATVVPTTCKVTRTINPFVSTVESSCHHPDSPNRPLHPDSPNHPSCCSGPFHCHGLSVTQELLTCASVFYTFWELCVFSATRGHSPSHFIYKYKDMYDRGKTKFPRSHKFWGDKLWKKKAQSERNNKIIF